MDSNEFLIRVIFYTKKRYIGEEFFQKNITLYEIKQYFNQNFDDGATLFYKNYYLNTIKLNDFDIISNIISPEHKILEISIALELREIEELKYQFSLTKFDDENDQVYSQIIKPKLNPFGLIVFFTKNNSIQIEQYPPEIIKKFNLDNFNKNYAYCNSPNFLFLSGENNFWIINKKNYVINHFKLKISKNKHSLIYVPKIGVFIVGGDTKKTFMYDTKTKKFVKWGDTNNYHYKPALIYYDEYLYSFQRFNNKNIFFEKTYLGENTQKKWEIIYPRFKDLDPNEFYEEEFAVSKSTEGKILLIGANKNHKNKKIYIYNPINDTIIKSEAENEQINFAEKIFYKLNKIINIAIPSDFELNKELVILNKYTYTLQKTKYIEFQNDKSINYEFNLDNNLELINDNQIGNISLQAKFEGKDYQGRFTMIRTIGIPIFKQINYIRFRKQFKRCICPPGIYHGSHVNLFKNDIGLKNENIVKRNNSQKAISIQHNDNIFFNKIKNEKKVDCIQKEKYEIPSKKIINVIIHKPNDVVFNKVLKANINNNKDENINKGNNKEQVVEIKTENNEQNQKAVETEQIKENINSKINNGIEEQKSVEKIDTEKEVLIKEQINEEKKEEKISENKINDEEDKVNVEESPMISEKQDNKNKETFEIFSHIKEIKGNPNYDRDETKTNKNMYQTNLSNFQFQESIQKNFNPTHFKVTSNEPFSENNPENLKESIKEINNNQNIEETNEDKNESPKNQTNEANMGEVSDNKGEFEEFHDEEQNGENIGQFEELSENNKEQENGFEQEDNIEKEINAQEVHEDLEPNSINNIKKEFNKIQKESNVDSGLCNENPEDNMVKNNKEENEYQNDEEENIINNDQDIPEQNIDLNDQNDGLFIEAEIKIDKNNNQNLEDELNSNKNNINIDNNDDNKISNLEQNIIKNDSDLIIKAHQEEKKETGIGDCIQFKIEENNSIKINEEHKEQTLENSSKNNTTEQKIINIDNIDQKLSNEKIITEEEEKGDFEEVDNEEYNYEGNEEQQILQGGESNYEENEEGQMIEEDYGFQNEENENNINGISYEPDEDDGRKEKGKENERDSIIHISDDENEKKEENNIKENSLQKYQKFVKNIEYDEPEDTNNFNEEK